MKDYTHWTTYLEIQEAQRQQSMNWFHFCAKMEEHDTF